MSEYKANSGEKGEEEKSTIAVKDDTIKEGVAVQNVCLDVCLTLQKFVSTNHNEFNFNIVHPKKIARDIFDITKLLSQSLEESIEFIGDNENELSKELSQHLTLLKPLLVPKEKYKELFQRCGCGVGQK
jgi:hypothetical protein